MPNGRNDVIIPFAAHSGRERTVGMFRIQVWIAQSWMEGTCQAVKPTGFWPGEGAASHASRETP